MTAYTDDDVTALARYRTPTFDVNGPEMQEMDLEWARGALDAVAPQIAARALREAADDLPTTWNAYTQPEHLQAWLRARAGQVNP